MPRVVVADPLSPPGLDLLREAGLEVVDATGAARPDLEALVADADAILVRSRTRVDRGLLECGHRLRVVGWAGIGADNVDVGAATGRGVLVFNVPGANLLAATEHTFALLLALARNLPAADAALKAGTWDRKRFQGVELHGKTLGVVGLGRIGQEVAARARAFGMEVLAHDPFLNTGVADRLGVPLLPLDELLERADVVTLHLPLTARSRGLFGAPELAGMKPGALLVNCARGGVVDEAALLDALERGHLGGAALDVFEKEPTPNAALVGHPRVVATPHLSAQTREAQDRTSVETARTLLEALSGSLAVSALNLPFTWSGPDNPSPLILAEQLGRLASSLVGGAVSSLTVELWGLDESLHRPLTLGATRGALLSCLAESVGYVNVEQVAASRGIELVCAAHAGTDGYANLIGITLTNGSQRIELAGTLFDGVRPRVVRFGRIPLEFAPEGRLLVLRSYDRPGVVGTVGTLLGEAGVNIADVHLARKDGQEDAWTVLRLDQAPKHDLLERLAALPTLRTVRLVELGHPWPAAPRSRHDSTARSI
jgi:D-3-phosphoglycerate dehydrogenase